MAQHDNNNNQPESKKEQNGRWRLGPYGHLRSGARPASIDKMKKRRMTKSMIIGLSSLCIAFVLAIVVFVLVQPEGTTTDAGSAPSGGNTSMEQKPENKESDESTGCSVEGSSEDLTQAPNSKRNKVNVNQLPDSSFLYDTDIAELAKADTFNDGQTVQVKGEVVGDAINDEDDNSFRWISLQDDDDLNPATLSVLVDEKQLALIDSFGRYGRQGSMLQVRGSYHLACADHDGLSDIHAEEVQVLSEGKEIDTPINPVVITAAVISVFLGGALLVLYSIRRERMR